VLDQLIEKAQREITKARVYNSPLLEKENTILLAHLLELQEHRKAFGLDKILVST
jgi:hypothetical protein